mmetsp:Transcript_61279/g.96694  ORF Transcript_61279/g.96694 Transcript_61279/m.96694 type:complete len:198 (-) Transcript_61279:268-861(-)
MRVLGVIAFLTVVSDARRVQATSGEQANLFQEQMQALLSDPSFVEQMQQMQAKMADPSFQQQLREIVADPSFQQQLRDVLADPKFRQEAERMAKQMQMFIEPKVTPRSSLASVLLAGAPALAGRTRSQVFAKPSQHGAGVRRTSNPLCMIDDSMLSTLSTSLAFNGQEDELIKAAWGALQAFFTFTIAQVCWARNGV